MSDGGRRPCNRKKKKRVGGSTDQLALCGAARPRHGQGVHQTRAEPDHPFILRQRSFLRLTGSLERDEVLAKLPLSCSRTARGTDVLAKVEAEFAGRLL
jgi:hypothetical protein